MRRCGAKPARVGVAAVALVCAFGRAAAQDADESASHGEMAFTYQYQRTKDLVTPTFVNHGAPVTTHLIDVDVSYRIKDRWTINAGLPLISREWKGGPSHNPLRIVPPQLDSDFVDDNHFHSYLQDLRFGASFALLEDPVSLEPFIEYGVPASDYPFFGASAPGRHMQTIEVGASVAYRPPFLKWYFSIRAGYAMSDAVLGIETDAMRVLVDAVYFVGPRVSLNVFLNSKNGKGSDTSRPLDMTSEAWYQHDRFTRHNFANLGVGVNWALDGRNVLNVTTLKMVHLEDVFRLRRALSVTLSRSF